MHDSVEKKKPSRLTLRRKKRALVLFLIYL